MKQDVKNWCIVGGGILGLRLAQRLADKGYQVTVLEASPKLGGLADSWKIGDVEWDRHYHVTLLSDFYLRDLLKELDLENDIKWNTTNTEFYADKKYFPLNNALDFLRFPPLGFLDKIRLATTILYASRITNGRPLERIRLDDWLKKWSGRRTFEKIWQPLLRAKLGENYLHSSASFIWAIIRRLYAARRSGLKTEMFGYVGGGYAEVFSRFKILLETKGVDIQTSSPVTSITHKNGKLCVQTKSDQLLFDNVAVTTAAPLAARICRDLNGREKEQLNDILYQGIVCASVLLKRPLHNAYITYITDKSVPFTAVIEMSALVDVNTFGGHSLVYLPYYVPSDDPIFEKTEAEIERRFLSGLREMYPELKSDEILAFRVSKVRQVLAVSTLNYSDKLPPMETSVPGLHIVNSAHIVNGTLNVNETLKLADEAIERLTGSSSTNKFKNFAEHPQAENIA